MKKMPIEMIGDIVRTFLVGVPIKSSVHPDWICDWKVDFYVERMEVMKIRRAVVSNLKDSKMEHLVSLANAMEDVFKEINKLS